MAGITVVVVASVAVVEWKSLRVDILYEKYWNEEWEGFGEVLEGGN